MHHPHHHPSPATVRDPSNSPSIQSPTEMQQPKPATAGSQPVLLNLRDLVPTLKPGVSGVNVDEGKDLWLQLRQCLLSLRDTIISEWVSHRSRPEELNFDRMDKEMSSAKKVAAESIFNMDKFLATAENIIASLKRLAAKGGGATSVQKRAVESAPPPRAESSPLQSDECGLKKARRELDQVPRAESSLPRGDQCGLKRVRSELDQVKTSGDKPMQEVVAKAGVSSVQKRAGEPSLPRGEPSPPRGDECGLKKARRELDQAKSPRDKLVQERAAKGGTSPVQKRAGESSPPWGDECDLKKRRELDQVRDFRDNLMQELAAKGGTAPVPKRARESSSSQEDECGLKKVKRELDQVKASRDKLTQELATKGGTSPVQKRAGESSPPRAESQLPLENERGLKKARRELDQGEALRDKLMLEMAAKGGTSPVQKRAGESSPQRDDECGLEKVRREFDQATSPRDKRTRERAARVGTSRVQKRAVESPPPRVESPPPREDECGLKKVRRELDQVKACRDKLLNELTSLVGKKKVLEEEFLKFREEIRITREQE